MNTTEASSAGDDGLRPTMVKSRCFSASESGTNVSGASSSFGPGDCVAGVDLHHGWSAKSPKSYWLRRHSDSLLFTSRMDRSLDEDDVRGGGAGRRLPPDADAPRGGGSPMDWHQALGGESAASLSSRPKFDERVSNGRLRETWHSIVGDCLPSSSSIDCDDVFDDNDDASDDQPSPKKANHTPTTLCSSALSPTGRRQFSPAPSNDVMNRLTMFFPASGTADEIAIRMGQLQSADRRPQARSQRSSVSVLDEQCAVSLPRIMEEREEQDFICSESTPTACKDREQSCSNFMFMSNFVSHVPLSLVQLPRQLSSSATPSASLSGTNLEDVDRRSDGIESCDNAKRQKSASSSGRLHPAPSSASGSRAGGQDQVFSSSPPESPCSGGGGGAVVGLSSTKLHRCSVCRRSFARSDMLERHARLHTGVRPYSCRLCSQVFSRSDHLTTHLRTHTGEKPYQCPRCSYSASRRDMVTRHLRIHVHDNQSSDVGGGDAVGRNGVGGPMTSMPLSPLTIGGNLTGKRRQVRTKKKDRLPVARVDAESTVVSKAAAGVQLRPSSWSSGQTSKPADNVTSMSCAASMVDQTPSRRYYPSWIAVTEHSDIAIKAAPDSWTRSTISGCPPPMRSSSSMTSFQLGDAATALSAGGFSVILAARGSTGSTDSYSPGCCSIPGSGDMFEFGGVAEGSPDVFRSPAAATRQTVKFLWPLVTPASAQLDTAVVESPSSYV